MRIVSLTRSRTPEPVIQRSSHLMAQAVRDCLTVSHSIVLVSVWTADRVFGLEQHSALLRPIDISSFVRTVPFCGVRMADLDEWVRGVNPMGWMGIDVDGRSKSH